MKMMVNKEGGIFLIKPRSEEKCAPVPGTGVKMGKHERGYSEFFMLDARRHEFS